MARSVEERAIIPACIIMYYVGYLTLCRIYSILRFMKHSINLYRTTKRLKKYEQLQITL